MFGEALMVVSDKSWRALRDLGLTEYEATAYTHLITSGKNTASQVSKNAGLPYSKIYDVLTSLEKKGWVEVESGRPKKYYPKPPSVALEATKLRVERSLAINIAQILGELQLLYRTRGIQERPDIMIVRGTFNVLARIREVVNESQRELMLATVELPQFLFDFLASDIRRLNDMGVQVKILVAEGVEPSMLRALIRVGEVRCLKRMFGGGVISDQRRVLLLLGRIEDAEYLAICSEHLGLVALSRGYFTYLWAEGRSITFPT